MAKRSHPVVTHRVTEAEAAKAASARNAAQLLGHTEREEFEAAVAAGAVEYTATRFMGRGVYDTRRSPDLAGAREHAKAMGTNRVLIYAINAAGRSVLVEAAGKPIDNSASPTKVAP